MPADLAQYKKDNPALLAQTYRHSSLLIKALKFVEMGDSNAGSHTVAMKILEDGMEALAGISQVKDGLGLSHSKEQVHEADCVPEQFDEFPHRVPKRKTERGRPTSKRQKAGHEKLSKRPRFCSLCRSEKHTLQTCPSRDPSSKKTRKPPTCSGCGISGHSVDRCGVSRDVNAVAEFMFL